LWRQNQFFSRAIKYVKINSTPLKLILVLQKWNQLSMWGDFLIIKNITKIKGWTWYEAWISQMRLHTSLKMWITGTTKLSHHCHLSLCSLPLDILYHQSFYFLYLSVHLILKHQFHNIILLCNLPPLVAAFLILLMQSFLLDLCLSGMCSRGMSRCRHKVSKE
jgi:hypothetical protein